MDEIKSNKEEKPKRCRKAKAICRETGDHIHYPPTRPTTSKRIHHAPSPYLYNGLESIFRFTRKVHYGECRKNQAAKIGTTAYDGCGEFVIATIGEDSMNCAACGCHRSFHRKESHSDAIPENYTTNGVSPAILEVLKLSSHEFRQIFCSPYGGGKDKVKEEIFGGDRISVDRSGGGDLQEEEKVGKVKRLKTKFTAEQTEKMRNYAEKLRWKLSPENREEADEFCTEIGVNRRKFRVWMSNHKDKN